MTQPSNVALQVAMSINLLQRTTNGDGVTDSSIFEFAKMLDAIIIQARLEGAMAMQDKVSKLKKHMGVAGEPPEERIIFAVDSAEIIALDPQQVINESIK